MERDGTLAILCGGLSTRLGFDKGLYRPLGDESLVARAIRLLGEAFREVLVVVKDEEQRTRYEEEMRALSPRVPAVRVVRDAETGTFLPRAPLSGVIAALAAASPSSVVALPVDMVGVRESHLRRLSAEVSDAPLAFASAETRWPFPSRWPQRALEELKAELGQGHLGVRQALRTLDARWLSVDETDTRELSLNANTRDEMRAFFGEPLQDPWGRRLHYLRLSLTEACNMACAYCLPDGFPEWLRHKARLEGPELETLLAGFRRLGFRKVRFTGGEPTVHPQCLGAIAKARELGFESIQLTTNGLLIPNLARYQAAGLSGINVSLDTLDAARFQRMTKSTKHATVLRLIDEALALPLPVKVNTVLLRSENGDEIDSLIAWALERPLTLRFIELMPTHLNQSFHAREWVAGSDIEVRLRRLGLSPLASAATGGLDGPARVFADGTHPGRIGLISPLSCNFCGACNRLRVTAQGHLKLCLFGEKDLPLPLTSAAAVAEAVRHLVGKKEERHHLERGELGNVATFRGIGG